MYPIFKGLVIEFLIRYYLIYGSYCQQHICDLFTLDKDYLSVTYVMNNDNYIYEEND